MKDANPGEDDSDTLWGRGNTNACPTTAEMVARHLVDNYGNIAVAATFLLRNNRSVPHF